MEGRREGRANLTVQAGSSGTSAGRGVRRQGRFWSPDMAPRPSHASWKACPLTPPRPPIISMTPPPGVFLAPGIIPLPGYWTCSSLQEGGQVQGQIGGQVFT